MKRTSSQKIKQNKKTLFKYIRGKILVQRSVGPLRNSTGGLVNDEGEMAGLLINYFVSTFT